MRCQRKGNNGNLIQFVVLDSEISNLPRHIAIIMDGNGRWAAQRGLSRSEGHRAGAQAVRNIVEECRQLLIPHLTLYAFSSENWNRPATEIAALFSLLLEFLTSETPRLIKQDIRLNVLGELQKMPTPQRLALQRAMAKTAQCRAMTLNLAINYGARAEILHAAKMIAASENPDYSEESFGQFLYTAGQPDPDLLIRTSGELRLSNFLLWQCAYSELYFTDTFWPDFTSSELHLALDAYAMRQRRFGHIAPPEEK